MIISRDVLKNVTGCDYYDGSIIHSRFAYKFFREKVHPVGNVVTFVAPAKVETEFMIDLEDVISKDFIYADSMIHFCYELPTTNLWGGVAFQRLYNTILGNILGEVADLPVEVEGDDIFVRKEFTNKGIVIARGKASVSIVVEKNGAILGHTAVNIDAGAQAPSFAYSTHMTPDQASAFQMKGVDVFYKTAHSIFVTTSKVK